MVARTLSWAWGCPCPFVTPCWTLNTDAAEGALSQEAGDPGFGWVVPLTVNPGVHLTAGLLGPGPALGAGQLIAEDSSMSDSES